MQVKITDTIEPKRTTICLLPTAPCRSLVPTESTNVTADRRSMKAMSACLDSIPIVSTSWIGHCLQQKNITVPNESMFVRTLPTKTLIGSISEFGVAYQAARIGHAQRNSSVPFLPLRRVKVAFMVGFDNTSNDTKSFCSLLSRAGVKEVVLNPSVASSRLKEFVAQGETKIEKSTNSKAIEYYVIVCNDDAKSVNSKSFISEAFLREIHNFSSSSSTTPPNPARRLMVVNVQWLFDSVTCGAVLPADTKSTTNENDNVVFDAQRAANCYRPKNERASELWEITK